MFFAVTQLRMGKCILHCNQLQQSQNLLVYFESFSIFYQGLKFQLALWQMAAFIGVKCSNISDSSA